MKIEHAVLREIRLRLNEPFEISSGVTHERRILLLTLKADGLEGWGECVAGEIPSYAYETTDTAWYALTELILPAVVGRSVGRDEADAADGEDADGGDRQARGARGSEAEGVLAPVAWIRGHNMAKAAVEMAAWDLLARAEGASLSERLGGTREAVPVGVSVGLKPTDEALVETVERYMADGYQRIKIKIKPGRDVDMLAAVRRRVPDFPVTADANSAYTLADAEHLRRLDGLGLTMIEQPLRYDDFLHHARLQELLETPICLDESVKSEGDLELALELGSGRILNIKPGRVGGHGVSRRLHDTMRARGLPVWCGGMLESGIGRAHNVALASLPGFTLPGDISASRRYWERDIVHPEFEVRSDGLMDVPTGPGIGVEVDTERVEALTVRRAVF